MSSFFGIPDQLQPIRDVSSVQYPLLFLFNPYSHCTGGVHKGFPMIDYQDCRFGPESSRQTLVSPIFRSSLLPSVADCFRKCFSGTNLQP